MSDAPFEIGADGLDVGKIVAEIREEVAEKTRRGVYADARIARAERRNLVNIKDDEDFIDFYLECLRDAVFVDINDFEIHERRRAVGRLLKALKGLIWKVLKFYTYRLWSQQNQVNGLLLTAVESVDEKYGRKIRELEKRLAEASESKAGGGEGDGPKVGESKV
ncbi:MAG: hypothetical protein JXR37_22595 [Kiritimatiellae bacterium]|nr:hypothetical protein [Kiritimatiellia bacterium]